MSWTPFSFGGPLLLAGALALLTPDSAQAQHRGGGHAGGFHAGGFHHSGFHHPGFHHPGFHGPGFHHHGFHHFGLGFYPYYYPSYGYYSPYSYYPSYNLGYGSTPELGNFDSCGGVAPSYASGYWAVELPSAVSPDTAPVQPDNTAHITVSVPPGAKIWFNDDKTTTTGSVGEFQSPPLTPGRQYAYEIRAR